VLVSTIEKVKVPNRKCAVAYLGTILPPGAKKGNTDDGLEEIVNRKFDTLLLPHIGTDNFFNRKKCHFIATMAKKLILTYLYDEEQEDRDHIGKKRVELAGDLMMQLFVSAFKFFFLPSVKTHIQKNKGTQRQIEEFEESPQTYINANIITKKLHHALGTGNWGISIG